MTGRPTLTRRILAAQVLVVIAMAVAIVAVAAAIGPAEFDRHMLLAGHADDGVLPHAEEAFRSAGLTALTAGIAIAVVGAIAVSVVLTRRIGAGLSALAAGAERVAAGDYSTAVELPSADRELASVAASFNAMAARIADTEATRRRLLTDLSHELRTPLAAVGLIVEGLKDGVLAPDAATLSTLRAQTTRLTRLAADLREVSAAEEGRLDLKPERVRLAELIEDAAATAAGEYETRGVRLDVSGVPDAELDADRSRIGQVLDNLLRNAAQHTPAGRSVHLWADATPDAVRIGVHDEGSGIAASDLPHVFERFYRAAPTRHDEGAGTGVGLAISRAIALAHGGTLTAASAGAGRGAEFVLTLPAQAS